MKLSLNWLQDHVDLTGRKTSELADILTFAGIEVEGVEERGLALDHVVVAQIKASEPHPKADRLSVCQVDDGSGQTRQIVCGAKNYRVGDKVPLALPGAVLHGGFTIKRSKLRDVDSEGMLCSGRELGLSEDHEGLLILSPESCVGAAIGELFESDTIFTIEVTPNRPDLLSHLGVAREIAVLCALPLKQASHLGESKTPTRVADDNEVHLLAKTCAYYTARRISGVKVGPSPDWLKRKLEAVGLRPINNIVDITNFVLLEMGQPLHAFDADQLKGGIQLRAAIEGEHFLALDGKAYELSAEDIVIADQERAVALGGVMGGEESGVTEGTVNLLLESAYFQPSAIRRTSRRLELSSDSSYRFERGVDGAQTLGASELATRLIVEIAGGQAEVETLIAGQCPSKPGAVTLDHSRAARLLGTPMSAKDMAVILSKLGLRAEASSDERSTWAIPSYRADLQRHVDLVEEIARVHGIDKIPARSLGEFAESSKEDLYYDAMRALGGRLADLGFHEAQTIKLVSEAQLADDFCALRLNEQNRAVGVKKPLSQDHTVLRPSLLPGLLAVAERNIRQGAPRLAFFEMGTVFSKHFKSPKALEARQLAILLAGDMSERSWAWPQPRQADIHDMVGLLGALFGRGDELLSLRKIEHPGLVMAAEILRGKTVLGRMGQVWPVRCRAMDWAGAAYVAEIDLTKALRIGQTLQPVRDLPKFPAVTRDVALEAPAEMPCDNVLSFLRERKAPLLVDVALFDLFADTTGAKLAADKKSLAFTLTYRSAERTLTSQEVDEAHGQIVEALKTNLGLRIR